MTPSFARSDRRDEISGCVLKGFLAGIVSYRLLVQLREVSYFVRGEQANELINVALSKRKGLMYRDNLIIDLCLLYLLLMMKLRERDPETDCAVNLRDDI